LVLPNGAGAESSDGTWTRILAPTGRHGHTAVFDPFHDRVIVFGGHDGTYRSDQVWILNTTGTPTWSRFQTLSGMPWPRYAHSAIYDPIRNRVILFGGDDGARENDTRALSLSDPPRWDIIEAEGEPPAQRYRHSAVYDPVRDRMIVFGGKDSTLLNDAWALDLSGTSRWSRLDVAGTPPSPRYGHTAIYDPVRDRMIVFGGDDGHRCNDTWALDLSGPPTWSRLSPTGLLPTGRRSATAVYDPRRDRMVVLGGHSKLFEHDCWSLALAGTPAWTRLESSNQPPVARRGHAAVYEPAARRATPPSVARPGSFRSAAPSGRKSAPKAPRRAPAATPRSMTPGAIG
jgi:hypothetical protein